MGRREGEKVALQEHRNRLHGESGHPNGISNADGFVVLDVTCALLA